MGRTSDVMLRLRSAQATQPMPNEQNAGKKNFYINFKSKIHEH